MRRAIRTLLLLLIFAAIFPFVYPWKDGKPMLSWSDIRMPAMPSVKLPEMPDISLPGSEREPHQPVKLYRWQGPDGGVQFSNEAPATGVAYEVVEVNPDANLIQATPSGGSKGEEKSETTDQPKSSLPFPSPLTVSPGEALQLLDDARKVRQLSEERLHQQEALTQ